MLVAKICLTGGPCGGKSTALAKIEKELTDMGYKVLIINEVATRIINSGIKPFGDDSISMLDFEEIMLKEQLTEEECYEITTDPADFNAVREALEKENIESRPVWKPMHMQPIFEKYDFIKIKKDEKSVGEHLFNRGVCLPSDTKMTQEDIKRVIKIVMSNWGR